ncbi:MAG: 50S ribosomal protein L3 [Candidatus Eisenbacteria sp.]|nr:50S ribosomal protein L3 [Candidatus Eisenbacteria bacterium]
MIGLIGKKVGMTQVFADDGQAIPVTVIEAGPCTVVDVKTEEKHGYSAVQLGFDNWTKKRPKSKPVQGQFDRAGVPAKKHLKEFRVADSGPYEVRQDLKADVFTPGEKIKVTGTSKGKGFAGPVRRWGFSGFGDSHGAKGSRAAGAVGMCATPARTLKGHKMAGRMGAVRRCVRNLVVVEVDPERNLLMVKGAVPGVRRGYVYVEKLQEWTPPAPEVKEPEEQPDTHLEGQATEPASQVPEDQQAGQSEEEKPQGE